MWLGWLKNAASLLVRLNVAKLIGNYWTSLKLIKKAIAPINKKIFTLGEIDFELKQPEKHTNMQIYKSV